MKWETQEETEAGIRAEFHMDKVNVCIKGKIFENHLNKLRFFFLEAKYIDITLVDHVYHKYHKLISTFYLIADASVCS